MYSSASTSSATVELRPSAPTTRSARISCSSPDETARTPTARPYSKRTSVTRVRSRSSAPASTAASWSRPSSLSRRGQYSTRPSAKPTSPHASPFAKRIVFIGVATERTAGPTPSSSRTSIPGGWIVWVERT